MKQSGKKELPRRRFLQQMVLLGGATGAGVLVLNNARAVTESPTTATAAVTKSTNDKGYRLTEHIRTYYDKAQKI